MGEISVCRIRNPGDSAYPESSTWNPKSTIRNPESKSVLKLGEPEALRTAHRIGLDNNTWP